MCEVCLFICLKCEREWWKSCSQLKAQDSTAPLPLYDFINAAKLEDQTSTSLPAKPQDLALKSLALTPKHPCTHTQTPVIYQSVVSKQQKTTRPKQKGQKPWSRSVNRSVMCHSHRVSMHFTHGRSPHACDVYRAFFTQVWDLTGI